MSATFWNRRKKAAALKAAQKEVKNEVIANGVQEEKEKEVKPKGRKKK